ncbi:four helix bundle protein [Patescibacteria group bacterium]
MEKPYKKYLVWQRAHELAILIYKLTSDFPKSEQYGLVSQLRRAAFSIPCNFVEGYMRGTTKEFLRFLDISKASLTEVEYTIEFAKDVNLLTEESYNKLEDLRSEAGFLLNKFIKSINKKKT